MREPADYQQRAQWLADEYLRVEHLLQAHGIGSTVVVFGSGETPHAPVVCVDRAFWKRAANIEYLAQASLLESTETALLRYADAAEEAWKSIEKEICRAGLGAAPTDHPQNRQIFAVAMHQDEQADKSQ